MANRLDHLSVLLVDDDRPSRQMTRNVLRRLGIEKTVEAESGEAATAELEAPSASFDLVICDLAMPGLSGIDVLKRARSIDPALPFLMVTGHSDAEAVKAAKENGVSAYLVKPFSTGDLEKRVRLLTARSKGASGSAA